MGAVYRALDHNTSQEIAIKVLLPSLFQNPKARERFLTEARIYQQLSHPKIVNVFDVQQDGELFFITMELLKGKDLREVFDEKKEAGENFSEQELVAIVEDVCTALDYAHKFTVHRNLKPENIWLCEDGGYKLMDFGIAQIQSTTQRTQTSAVMGTVYYMAPEQLKGSKNIDTRADVYALGVLIYELSSRDVPAGVIKPLKEKRKDLSKRFCLAVMSALQADLEDRPESVGDLYNLLAGGKSRSAPSVNFSGLLTGAKWLSGAVVAGALVWVLMTIGFFSQVWEAVQPTDRELIAQQQADANRAIGEIRKLSNRLENSIRDLERDVDDAERDSSLDYSILSRWFDLAEIHIRDSGKLLRLEGELNVGETLLRDESQSAEALESLLEVRVGYEALATKFDDINRYLGEMDRVDGLLTNYESLQSNYGFSDPPARAELEGLMSEVKLDHRGGAFGIALNKFNQIAGLFELAERQVQDQIAAIDEEREAARIAEEQEAERERQAELERQRIAAEQAERERQAELERQRIAAEQAERERQAELERQRIAAEQAERERQAELERQRIAADNRRRHEQSLANWEAEIRQLENRVDSLRNRLSDLNSDSRRYEPAANANCARLAGTAATLIDSYLLSRGSGTILSRSEHAELQARIMLCETERDNARQSLRPITDQIQSIERQLNTTQSQLSGLRNNRPSL